MALKAEIFELHNATLRTELHALYKREFGKHISYKEINHAYKKACRKWTRGGQVKLALGLISEKTTLLEMLSELTDLTVKVLNKKYRVDCQVNLGLMEN